MRQNGSNCRSSRPTGLNPANPQFCPAVLRTSGGAPTAVPGQDRILVAPCVEAVVAHADGDIEIKPDSQIARASVSSTQVELLVGDPLHELDKADIRRHFPSQPRDSLIIDSSPSVGPFPPRTRKFPAQHLEARKPRELETALLAEIIERLPSCRGAVRPKRFICELERARLDRCNPVIVDGALVPKPPDLFRQPGRAQPGKFRHRPDVDIKRIEKEAAIGKIWTCLMRPIIEQSMQRVESDTRRPEIGG